MLVDGIDSSPAHIFFETNLLNTNVFAHFIDILFVSLGKSMIALNESDVFNEIAFTEPTLKLAAWDGYGQP